ncbi:Fe(3+)-citrate-binding protein YfmC precursor [compost metagenome]
MKRMLLWIVLTILAFGGLAACGSKNEKNAQPTASSSAMVSASPSEFLTFKDSTDQTVVLKTKPERIVILNNELLTLFYQIGGKTVGYAISPGSIVPEEAKSSTEVGQINQISLEKVMSLKPDLVIGHPMFHSTLKDSMKTADIPMALIKLDSYEGLKDLASLFGKIASNEAKTTAGIQQLEEQVKNIQIKLPNQSPKFAIITVMPMGISLQKSSSIALDLAGLLKLQNVIAHIPASGAMPSSVPYSLEKLVEQDPDLIFLVAHGTEEFGKQKLKSDLENNPAWASLRAVKEKKLFFLPSSLFVTPPGLQVNKSLEHMAKLVFPEVYGSISP